MLHGVQASSAFHQLRSEGITFLYRGIFPPLAQKTVSLALMFGKCFHFTHKSRVLSPINSMTFLDVTDCVSCQKKIPFL